MFAGDARFNGATFYGDAWFDGVTFSRDVRFSRGWPSDVATFTKDAWFSRGWPSDGATFFRAAVFNGATFARDAEFTGSHFVSYDNAQHDDLKGAVFVMDPGYPFPGARYGPLPRTGRSGHQVLLELFVLLYRLIRAMRHPKEVLHRMRHAGGNSPSGGGV